MKKYNTPEMEIRSFDASAIITVSSADESIFSDNDRASAAEMVFSDWDTVEW